jgi:hypothetical protein
MAFAGFDMARYPGDTAMQSLWESSNLYWVGYYLAVSGPGLSDKRTWSGKYKFLRGVGWGVAPIYVGKQPSSKKLELKRGTEEMEGYLDGVEAAGLADQEGMPNQCVLYFDLEVPTGSKPWMNYYLGWAKAILDQGYQPGLYGSFLTARSIVGFLRERDPRTVPQIWVFNLQKFPGHQSYKDINEIPSPDPNIGVGGATCWQFVQGSKIAWPGHLLSPVDFNSSVYGDPGTCTSPAT